MSTSQKTETDVLIIGGGAIGVCAAYYLAEQGRQVTVVEMGEVCSGSSYGNAGLVVPSHCVPLAAPGVILKALKWMRDPESPFYLKPRLDLEFLCWLWRFRAACTERRMRAGMPILRNLSLASLDLFDELNSLEGMDCAYEKKGLLVVFRTEAGLEDAAAEARLLQEAGVETKVLDAPGAREMEPMLRDDVAGAVFHVQDTHLVPDRFVCQLARYVDGKGVEVRPRTEVLGFETSNGRITSVKTTRGDFAAGQVVLAAGSWSPVIAKELRIKLPIQAAKGYSVTYKRPAECPAVPTVLGERKVAVTPMGEFLRFGGTLELAGLNLAINKRRVAAILKAVPQYFAELDPGKLELLEIWRGLRPCTPDGLPFLGRSKAYENLIVAAGHAMIGISLAPITGKLVAQIAANETPSIDISTLSVERYG